ncbi:MAG: DUF952 domain-containing protein [Phototrophicales bacterium]|nr:MAG: DUF952 domain-containing protein [Phototrophicales bacterium]
MTIYHVTTTSAWQAAQQAGQYVHESLQHEGFIHCSTREQIGTVLNHFYHGQEGLLLLVIDDTRLVSPLQYDENIAPNGTLDHFPHLYGPLNLDAVIEQIPLAPNPDGSFSY